MSRSDTADRRFRVFCDACDWHADATHPNSLVARAEAERHDERNHDGQETADVEVVTETAEPEIVTDGGIPKFGVTDMLPNSPLSDDEIDEWEGLISPVAAPADTDGWTQAIFLNPSQKTHHGLDWDVEEETWYCFHGLSAEDVRDALAERRVSHHWFETDDYLDRGQLPDHLTELERLSGDTLVRCLSCASRAETRQQLEHHEDCPHSKPEIVSDGGEDIDAGGGYFWDAEPCPRDGCEGELQQQDKFNVMCLTCEGVWTHVKNGSKHYLQTEDYETVAEKQRVATDGGKVDEGDSLVSLVELPSNWEDWSEEDKIKYLDSQATRTEVFEWIVSVADLSSGPKYEPYGFQKRQLIELVLLLNDGRSDEGPVDRGRGIETDGGKVGGESTEWTHCDCSPSERGEDDE